MRPSYLLSSLFIIQLEFLVNSNRIAMPYDWGRMELTDTKVR